LNVNVTTLAETCVQLVRSVAAYLDSSWWEFWSVVGVPLYSWLWTFRYL